MASSPIELCAQTEGFQSRQKIRFLATFSREGRRTSGGYLGDLLSDLLEACVDRMQPRYTHVDGRPEMESMESGGVENSTVPPLSVVWTPIHPITWCCPFVGHMGITDSKGYLHDWHGCPIEAAHPRRMLFGAPARHRVCHRFSRRVCHRVCHRVFHRVCHRGCHLVCHRDCHNVCHRRASSS